MTTEQWYSVDFGIEVDEAAWEEDYEKVVDGLAEHLERATGIALTGWDSPARGGVYFVGREKHKDGQKTEVWMRPNFVPESGDWGMPDYRSHTVIVGISGDVLEQVDGLQKSILASRELGATLLERKLHQVGQKRKIIYSLKDAGKRIDG